MRADIELYETLTPHSKPELWLNGQPTDYFDIAIESDYCGTQVILTLPVNQITHTKEDHDSEEHRQADAYAPRHRRSLH